MGLDFLQDIVVDLFLIRQLCFHLLEFLLRYQSVGDQFMVLSWLLDFLNSFVELTCFFLQTHQICLLFLVLLIPTASLPRHIFHLIPELFVFGFVLLKPFLNFLIF